MRELRLKQLIEIGKMIKQADINNEYDLYIKNGKLIIESKLITFTKQSMRLI
jgi:hypothetical protein